MQKTLKANLAKYLELRGVFGKYLVPKDVGSDIHIFLKYEKERRRRETKEIEARNAFKYQIQKIVAGLSESPVEKYLLNAFSDAGISGFKQQHQIGKYRVDFAFPDKKVAIEADGAEWHQENMGQIERDQKRDIYLARKGWTVIHLPGLMIRRDIQGCIAKVRMAL